MFRGRPPPRGSYRPPFDSRGPPPPPRPYHHQRADDRNRARSPYHSGYHRRGHPDYHHFPPHRGFHPPASAGHRGDQHRFGAPPRERSPSPRHRLPIDHKLVITVGNELTGSASPRQHSRDRSMDIRRGRSRSRARSKSRHCSRGRSRSGSGSRSRSRSRSRGRIRGRASSRAPSRRRSSSSNSSSNERHRRTTMFDELEEARRRKELEDLLCLPTKSILKKRSDYNCSPTVRSSDSALSQVAQELLRAVKGMEPAAMASVLSELRSDPQMWQRADRNPEIKEILNLLDPVAAQGAKSPADDMDDEEKFLYGDSEDPEIVVPSQPLQNHAFDPYGDVTEDVLYEDLPRAAVLPAVSPVATGEAFTDRAPSVSAAVSHTAMRASIPGPPPEEENHQQAQEDYRKLQDLLKTIGLDLGVTELSKLAARTKERLHGNKPAKAPKTPKRRPRYSSDSSDDGRSRRSLSRSSSGDDDKPGPGAGRAHSRNTDVNRLDSWSKDGGRGVGAAPDEAPEQTVSLDAAAPIPSAVPVPPSYRASPASGTMAPSYPPPGYAQYGSFLPYAHPQWPPPMYPPPSLQAPGANSFPTAGALPYHQPDTQRLPEPQVKGVVKSPWVAGTGPSQVSEQENNESQKQKVLEERENLRQEREQRMKKKEYLMKELERLRKQQGELLRKKRREKDGHKDPLLQEISLLQEDIMMQISNLRREHEAAEKKRGEIDKVALILGLGPSDRPRPTPRATQADHAGNGPGKSRLCTEHSQEGQRDRDDDDGGASPKNISEASRPALVPPGPLPEPFEYYDAGNHWCKSCNLTSGSMFDFFNHLHSKTHRKTLDPYERPWAAPPTQMGKKAQTEDKQMKPAKGSEFLLPVRGFFCVLCEKFFGDTICAEEHVTAHCHNDNYKKRMYKDPLYEQRRNLDRQAGLDSNLTGKKRKPEEDVADKTKSKKERKGEKEFGTEDASSIVVEEEEKPKVPKKEDELKTTKTPFYARKEEDNDKVKSKKKSDKYHWSVEEDERASWRRDEEERHKPSQGGRHYRHRGHEEDPYERRPRHDDRRKHEREREDKDGGREKNALAAVKPYDPPRIICGPSPAMRAKLLKQSPDAAKLAPTFGRFTWRKRENQLAKDAQKAAAEFIKDDERAAKEANVPKDDSFAKSVAFAKEIAQKLSGAGGSSAPRVSIPGAAQGRNHTGGKPTPLNAVPSVAPQGPGRPLPPAEDGPIFPPLERLPETKRDHTKPTSCESEIRPARPASRCVPHLPGPPPSVPKAALPVSSVRPAPPIFRSVPSGPEPSSPASTPTPGVVRPAPPRSSPAVTAVGPAPPTVRSAPSGAGSPASSAASSVRSATAPPPPLPSSRAPPPSRLEVNRPAPPSRPELNPTAPTPSGLEINPAPEVSPPIRSALETEMADMEPDVAAPGVPESEQTHAVFVKPPPLFCMLDGGQRSDKPKSNLAAAKAQDLFGIFYSSEDKTGPLSLIKSSAADVSVTLKSPFVTQTVPHAAARPSNPSPQTDPGLARNAQPRSRSELRIESIWSLQTSPERAPAGVLLNSSVVKSAQEEHPESTPAHASQTLRQVKTCEPKPDDENPPWTFPEPLQETPPSPKAKSAPGPRARGKNAKKRTTPSSGVPVRRTRSQTRSQTGLRHLEQTVGDADQEPSESPGDTDPKLSEPAGDVDRELSESAGDIDQEFPESAGDADQEPSESPGDTDPKLSESAGDIDQEFPESVGDADQEPSESAGDADQELSESAGDADQELSESAGDADQELPESSDCCSGTQHDGSTLLTPDNLHSSAIMADLNLA